MGNSIFSFGFARVSEVRHIFLEKVTGAFQEKLSQNLFSFLDPVTNTQGVNHRYPDILEFFLNVAELSTNSVNSANSGNLINHWSMNWAQFKDPISHMCLTEFSETFKLNPHLASSVKRQIGCIVYMVTIGNGSGVNLECQVKRHHRLALVTLPLPLDARCGYALREKLHWMYIITSLQHVLSTISVKMKSYSFSTSWVSLALLQRWHWCSM